MRAHTQRRAYLERKAQEEDGNEGGAGAVAGGSKLAAAPAVLLYGARGEEDDAQGAVMVDGSGRVMVFGSGAAATVAGKGSGGGAPGAAADLARSMVVRQSAFDDDEVFADRDPDEES